MRGFTLIMMWLFCVGLSQAQAPLDPQAQAIRDALIVPGVAIARFSSSEIELGAAGVRIDGQSELVTTADQFHLGSNQKAMTALMIAKLIEAGLLDWDRPMTALFPALASSMRVEYRQKTLLDLLTHKAGIATVLDLGAILALPTFSSDPMTARMEFTEWALQQPPDLPPGADAAYSNGGLTIAAAAAELVAGQRYELLLPARVLTPLGIPARFRWPASGNLPQPWGHTGEVGAWSPNDPDAPENQFPQFLNPAGNISMTLSEYARTVQQHLRGLRGGCDGVSNATWQLLNTPRSSLGLSPAWGVGDIDGEPTSSFEGSAGTFYVAVKIQPRRNKGVVVAINAVEESEAFFGAVEAATRELLSEPALEIFGNGFEGCAG